MREVQTKVRGDRTGLYRAAHRGADRQPGMQVVGVDNKEDVVKTVGSGAIHISEPDLDGLVSKGGVERRADALHKAGARRRLHHCSADAD